ncbi:MAG: hypothetical protein M0Q53_06815 [Prolixibacteraceae bacterium]|nr:hypothetical protein [Prolixibacteraceae bacterium]
MIFIVLFLVLMIPVMISYRMLKPVHIERPAGKIGFHDAVNDKNGYLLPSTTWEDALKREMNWYYKAPKGKMGYPVYFYSAFIGDDYLPYKNEIIPCTQLEFEKSQLGHLFHRLRWRTGCNVRPERVIRTTINTISN